MKPHCFSVSVGLLTFLASLAGIAQNAPENKIAKDDRPFLAFGKVIPAIAQKELDWKNPHQVTAYAVWMCCHGKTNDLAVKMGNVERDTELGKALTGYIKEFGPDLERYKNANVSLKFHGYSSGKDTSVWYYWLTDRAGKNLEHSPWVSTHRSQQTQRCALTGIFLHEAGSKDVLPPKGLITFLPGQK